LRDEEIDHVLGGEEDVLPSSGFHASVMEAVHREATAPPPIPFPWKRVGPAVAAASLSPALLLPIWDSLLPAAESVGAPWIVLAALTTALSLLLSRRLAEERY
jgi:hypothetical protein